MKIDYAVMSSDDNPMYLDFWPVVSKLWAKLGIVPVLLYFGDKSPSIQHGEVVHMPRVPGVPLYLQCTCSRLWFPGTRPDKTTILADIDMLPLSKWYFCDQVAHLPPDKYAHLNPCIETYGQLAMCYNIALGSTFREILTVPIDWAEAANMFLNTKPIRPHTAELPLWFVDETILTNKVLNYKDKNRIVLLRRPGGQNGFRIDRPHWVFDKTLLKQGKYFDCHSARPFEKYKNDILTIAGEV